MFGFGIRLVEFLYTSTWGVQTSCLVLSIANIIDGVFGQTLEGFGRSN